MIMKSCYRRVEVGVLAFAIPRCKVLAPPFMILVLEVTLAPKSSSARELCGRPEGCDRSNQLLAVKVMIGSNPRVLMRL
jgi:hypothetical protein